MRVPVGNVTPEGTVTLASTKEAVVLKQVELVEETWKQEVPAMQGMGSELALGAVPQVAPAANSVTHCLLLF